MMSEMKTQIEVGGRPVGMPLTESQTVLILNWLESDGVAEALSALHPADQSGTVLDLSELPPEVDMLSFGRNGDDSWAATVTRFDGCYARTEDGRGSTPVDAFHAALDAWRKR